VDGEFRELHLDKAIDVLNFNKKPDIIEKGQKKVEVIDDAEVEKLIRNEYFAVERIVLNGSYKDENKENFKILSILDGEGTIEYENTSYKIKKGDTYFIPASLNSITLKGNIELLKSYI
jgi:mannose-6-phosphate isomerase